MNDEEKKAINEVKHFKELTRYWQEEEYEEKEIAEYITTILNLIEKQSKEIELLKEDRKKYAEEYIHNNPWLYKQLNENYILRVESEQRERKAYIKGTNDADELCNKKWKDKIKAKIEEVDIQLQKLKDGLTGRKTNFVNKNMLFAQKEVLQSLLEKE